MKARCGCGIKGILAKTSLAAAQVTGGQDRGD